MHTGLQFPGTQGLKRDVMQRETCIECYVEPQGQRHQMDY